MAETAAKNFGPWRSFGLLVVPTNLNPTLSDVSHTEKTISCVEAAQR